MTTTAPRSWVVKGNPARNDLSDMLVPGRKARWVTRRPPRDLAAGDHVFFWKSKPARHLLGLGVVRGRQAPDADGDTLFDLEYLTEPFASPLGIEELRVDPVIASATFLKAGVAGTVYPLTSPQATRLLDLATKANPGLRGFTWGSPGKAARTSRSTPQPVERAGRGAAPSRALSIRQPWAEFILCGMKTIEIRSQPTKFVGRTLIYAGLREGGGGAAWALGHKNGIDTEELPRGVVVGSVEVVGCRPLLPTDWKNACFEAGDDVEGYAWLLANPVRAKRLRKPTKQPQPVWFTPF